jgi:hypothetical protein
MENCLETQFIRELHEDWRIHSYCSRCLATVANSTSVAKVKAKEDEHKCDPGIEKLVTLFQPIEENSSR